jgi:hypothetical protein
MVYPMQHMLSSHEWKLLRQCLNEVLHGFKLQDTQTKIGMSEEHLSQFLGYLNGLEDNQEIRIDSSRAIFLVKVLRETLREFPGAQFRERTGYKFREGEALFARLAELVAPRALGIKPPEPI